jgi:hypothetical protein
MAVKEAGTPGVLKMVSCYFSLNLLTKSTIEFCHGDLELSSFRTGEGAGTQERERERESFDLMVLEYLETSRESFSLFESSSSSGR